jgi:hypothetical protein
MDRWGDRQWSASVGTYGIQVLEFNSFRLRIASDRVRTRGAGYAYVIRTPEHAAEQHEEDI